MPLDLVQTTTRDGIRLDGSFQSPTATGSPSLPLDAVCMIHGTGGNFYGSTLFDDLASRLLELGCAVLRVNTRGHDGISTAVTARGGRRLGAAYEVVDDCRHDVAAWTEWLRQRTKGRVGLIGHSLGAVKSLYALAHEPSIEASCVIALSPPRLSYSWFCTSPEGPQFLEVHAAAERLLEQGQPAALLDVKLPLPFVITAAGYVEKYGPEERYNYLRFLPGVPVPTLVTFGSIEAENNMAFRGAAGELQALGKRQGPLVVQTLSGADHFYSGVRQELLAQVEAWVRSGLH